MAKKPLRIADALGFGASRRDLTQTYRRAVDRPATQYVGEVANPRRTYSQRIAQALTPNTKFGADIANRLSTFLDTFTPLGAEEPLVRARNAMGRGDYGDAAFQGAIGILSGIPGAGGLEGKVAKGAVEKAVDRGLLDAAEKGIIAYHGSPHSFDKFDISKIGTGEGAQAYGHGLYFAEAEDVARSYRQKLEKVLDEPFKKAGLTEKEIEVAQSYARQMDMSSPDVAARDFAAWTGKKVTPELVQAFKSAKEPGSMYQVRINANPEDFIVWDELLDKQSTKVKNVLGEGGIIAAADILSRAYRNPMYGGDLLKIDRATPAEVSRGLLEKGIAGIKYRDALSRGKENPTSNFVVFDDALIDILKKYGIAVPFLAGGGLLASHPQQDGGL